MAIIRGGSWGIGGFKLPEFGLTERLAGRVSGGQTRDLSQAITQRPQAAQTKAPSGLQFIGPTYTPPQAPSVGYQGGGQSSGGGQPTPSGNQSNFSVNDVLQQEPQAPQIDFDALIAPALQGLEEAIAPMQQEFANTQASVEAGKTSKTAKAKQEFGAQEALIGQARTGQTQQAESAVGEQQRLTESAADEARRQFAEVQQGLQARYGGTTGTGRFAAELAGRQTMQNIGSMRGESLRNIANIRQNLSQVVAGLDDKLVQVKEIGRIALQDIQDQGDQQIRDAKNRLDTALADIRRQKGEIQSRKAELASNAIQWYQGEVNRVKQQNAQFLQGLFNQQQAAEQQLQLAMQKAKSTGSNLPSADYNAINVGGQPFVWNKRTGEGSLTGTGAPAFGTDEENPALAGGNASGLSPEEREILGL